MSVPADNAFADLVPSGKDDGKGNAFADLIPRNTGPHAPITPVDTGAGAKLKGEAGDAAARAAGGAVGDYNALAQFPGMILGGAAAGPAAILHALFPDTMPTAGEALAEGTDLFQVHPSGRMGEGEQAAEQTLSLPFEKAADVAGDITARASDPNAPTEDANFQSRFGIQPVHPAPETLAQAAQREAKTRTVGEALTNLAMMLGGGKEGVERVEAHEAPAKASAPAFNEAHARALGLDQGGANMFSDLIPVTLEGESHPVTADEADERVHQPVEVAEAQPPENIELKGTLVQNAAADLDQAIQHHQAESAIQDLNQRVADDNAAPPTEGIESTPGTMTRMEVAEPPNQGIRENPSLRGIDVQEIPQEQMAGGADEGNAAEAAQDRADEQLRAALYKPNDEMTHEELRQLAGTDPLTLMPNRREFEVKDRQQPANAYSAIDLVGFKGINDTVGHASGDVMLQAWGKILRRSGLDAYRTGGDEFTVRGDSAEQLQQDMERLKAQAAGTRFTFKTPDGKTVEKGLDFRYGIGDNPRAADETQIRNRDPGRQTGGEGSGGPDRAGAAAGQQAREGGAQGAPEERVAAQAEGSVAAKGGKFSRRIMRTPYRSDNDFIVPETPEFEGNTSGDLAQMPAAAAKAGIQALPIRLHVGRAVDVHRGFGIEHIADSANRDSRREAPVATGDRAEDTTRHIVNVARSFNEIYQDGKRYILRSARHREALVVEPRTARDGSDYYSIITTMPAKDAGKYGRPVWTGRRPAEGSPPLAATEPGPGHEGGTPGLAAPVNAAREPRSPPDLSPGEKPAPGRQSLGVRTEHYDLPPKPEGGQGRKSVGEGEGQSVNTLRVALQKGLGMSKVSRLEQAGIMELHERGEDIPASEADRASEAGKIQGYWDGKTMHLAADGIAPGDELPVAIHEAIHKVQEDPKVRDDLRKQFKRLVAQQDPVAMQAVLRIPEDTPDEARHDEGVAYIGEEVAKTAAADRAGKFSKGVLNLARDYYHAIRARFYMSPLYKAAQRAGVNLDLTPKDIAAIGRYELRRSGGSMRPGGFTPGDERPPRNPGESQEAYAKRLMGSDKQQIQSAMDEARRQQKVGRANFKAMLAQRARALDTADAAFEDARKTFDKQGDEANLKSIDEWETGTPVRDPMARQFFELMDKAFTQRIAKVRELAPEAMQHLIENYFPHIWEDTGKAQKWYQSVVSRAPLEGNKSFMKQRTWGTIKEGMASGLKPVSTNPVDMAIAKLGQMDKFIAFHEFRKDLDDRGWLQTMKAGERVPDGYARVNDPAFEKAGGLQGYFAAPELIARDVNRYLEPGLYKYGAWRGIRTFQNVLLAARLGLSAFHAGFTTMDTAISHLGVAFQAAADGDMSTAAKMLARTVASPLASPIEGSKLFKQFYGKVAADADTAAVLHALEEGGARGRMQSTDYNSSWEKLGRSIRKSSLSGTALHMLPGIMEGTSRWLTHHLVPWQKMAARTLLMKFELDRHAQELGREKGDYAGIVQAMHPDALRQIAGKVVQDVDDRLGQLAYDNLFMNRILKDVAQATVQSVGWNIGTFRTIVGAAADTRHLFKPEKLVAPLDREGKLQDRNLARISGRLSYLIALNAGLATIGSTYQYLATGKPPESLKDMFYPRTGRTNPDGSEERLSFPTYIKDEYALATHPIQTVEHKVHPSISMALELLNNKDFYGAEIHNPDDPWTMQAKQIGEYIVSGFEPYAFENEQQAEKAGGGPVDRALPFVGVTPAPADIDRSDFQQFVAENGTRGYSGFTTTPEKAETSQKKRAAEDALRTGRDPDYTGLSDRQVLQAEKEGQIPKPELQFQRLGIEDKLRAYDMATPDERQQYHLRDHLLHGRVMESVRRLPEDEQQPVLDRLREIEAGK